MIPARQTRLLDDPDPARAMQASEAKLRMTELDVAGLEAAADGS